VLGFFYPRIDYAESKPGYLILEFPLFNLLGACFLTILDDTADYPIRLPSFYFFVFSLLFLYLFISKYESHINSMLLLLLFTLLPSTTLMSVAAQPDQASLFFVIFSIYLFDSFVNRRKIILFILFSISASLAVLTKISSAYLIFPILGVMLIRDGKSIVTVEKIYHPRYLFIIFTSLSAIILWQLHSICVNSNSFYLPGISVAKMAEAYIFQRGRFNLIADLNWYRAIWENIVYNFSYIPPILFIFGFLASLFRRSSLDKMSWFWLLGLVVYLLVFPYHSATHNHYLLVFSPLVAIYSITLYSTLAARRNIIFKLGSLIFMFIVSGFLLSKQSDHINEMGREVDMRKVDFGNEIQRIVPEGQKIIVIAKERGFWNGSLIYNTRREGWLFSACSNISGKGVGGQMMKFPHRLQLINSINQRSMDKQGKIKNKPIKTDDPLEKEGVSLSYAEDLITNDRKSSYCLKNPEQLNDYRERGAKYLAYYGNYKIWRIHQRELYDYVLKESKVIQKNNKWVIVEFTPLYKELIK